MVGSHHDLSGLQWDGTFEAYGKEWEISKDLSTPLGIQTFTLRSDCLNGSMTSHFTWDAGKGTKLLVQHRNSRQTSALRSDCLIGSMTLFITWQCW